MYIVATAGHLYKANAISMYPSNYRSQLISIRRQRRAALVVSHLFVAAVTLLGSLSLFAAVINH